jgi:hypothetical protein
VTVQYSGGTARLYAKDIEKPVADIRYQMMSAQPELRLTEPVSFRLRVSGLFD